DTSHSFAPSRRMRTISVTRKSACALLAFFPFMFRDRLQDPTGVPLRQGRVVDKAELFSSAAIAAEVSRSFDCQFSARCEGEGDYLGVAMATGRALLAAAELGKRFLPEQSVMRPEEDARQQGQADNLSGVQPAQHRLEVAGVITQRPDYQPVTPSQALQEGA